MRDNRRSKRIGELIRAELINSLSSTVEDPLLRQVSITDILVSPDLKTAKVFFRTDEPQIKEVTKRIAAAQSFFRKQLARNLDLRSVPELRFEQDSHPDNVSRLLDIFQEIDHAAT